MAEMGFGLNWEMVMYLAFKIVDMTHRHLQTRKQAMLGLMVSVTGIPSCLHTSLSLHLICMHSVQTQIP